MPVLEIRFIDACDPISEAIAWVEGGSLWIHTEGKNRTGDKWVGAHAGTGIQARPLDWCKDITQERRYQLEVTPEQYEAAMAYMERKIGTPYDYTDIAGLFLHDRRLNSSSREICSAFMVDWLFTAEQFLLNCLPGYEYLITPETLHLSGSFRGHGTFAAGG
jgi:hypothetical protein